MIKFGTSGFRGIIGDNWTKENIQKIGFAFRKIAEEKKKQIRFVIGYDNRFMGREAAIWFCEAACSEQIQTTFMNVSIPTPFAAYKAVTDDFGIIITASHNPYFYNGIKIFLHGGKEADDDFCNQITKYTQDTKGMKLTKFNELVERGFVTFSESTDDYVNQIVSQVDKKTIKSSGLKVLINPMYGSGTAILKKLFKKFGLEWHAINENLDPFFGGTLPCPYPHMLTKMAEAVVKGKYDFGVAVDGDADRVAVIDCDGKFYDCNYLGAAFYYYLTQIKKQKGGAVKNILTSNLINKLCTKYGFDIHETLVGFKFLGVPFEKTDAIIAVESGGMGFKAISLSKDGVATAAFLVDLIAATKKSIGTIVKELEKLVSFPSSFVEYAYPFDGAEREALLEKLLLSEKPKFSQEVIKVNSYFDGFKAVLKGDYWCAARLSGNENVLRIYAEMADEKTANEVIGIMEKFYNVTERQK